MRLEQLRYFIEVAKSESISIAAENLFVTQPALSRNIKAFEEEMGVVLFTRNVDGVHLTDDGKQLLPEIVNIYKQINLLFDHASCLGERSNGLEESRNFIIYTVPTFADSLLPFVIEKFEKEYSSINVIVRLFSGTNLFDIHQAKDADLIIYMGINKTLKNDFTALGFNYEPLFTEGLSIVVKKDHELSKKSIIDPSEVYDQRLIIHQHIFNSDEYLNMFYPVSKDLNIILRSNNTRALSEGIMKRDGVFVSHNLFIRMEYYNNPEVKVIPVKNVFGYFFALYRTETLHEKIINRFIEEIKRVRLENGM